MSLEARYQQVVARHSELQRFRSSLQHEIKASHDEVLLLEKVESVLHNLATRVMGQSTGSIDKLITGGLRDP